MKRFLILILFLLPQTTIAAGIEVSPAKLELSANPPKPAIAELVVTNPAANVQLFEIYPDEFAQFIKAEPASFVLESGTQKTVRIVVTPPAKSQAFHTLISVLGKPLAESSFQANTGVKIPLSLNTQFFPQTSRFPKWLLYLGGTIYLFALLLVAGLTAVHLWRKFRRPKSS